jgi:hypothetical protein
MRSRPPTHSGPAAAARAAAVGKELGGSRAYSTCRPSCLLQASLHLCPLLVSTAQVCAGTAVVTGGSPVASCGVAGYR